jgi:hypothetical protein
LIAGLSIVGRALVTRRIAAPKLAPSDGVRDAHLRILKSGRAVSIKDTPLPSHLRRRSLGFPVVHGSPHRFKKFDTTFAMTGEGAQVKGHGLYMASARPVAVEYAQKLARTWKPAGDYKWGGRSATARYNEANRNSDYAKMDVLEGILLHRNKGMIQRDLMDNLQEGSDRAAASLKYLAKIPDNVFAPSKGHVYDVRLAGHARKDYLDLDRKISDQHPAVLARLHAQFGAKSPLFAGKTMTGEDFYKALAKGKPNNPASLGEFKAASEWLGASGLKGMRYLDSFSRQQGIGTSNFVAFSGKNTRITRVKPSEAG